MSNRSSSHEAGQVTLWPFWKLPRTLAAFVAAVILADLAVFAAAAAAVPVSVHDLEVFAR
jgi:hypothetical protein